MDPQHHDTAERRFQSGQPSVSSYSVLQRLLPQLSVLWPLGNSASAVGDLGLFEEEAAVVPEYDPSEYDPPAIFVFTHVQRHRLLFFLCPCERRPGTSYDYSSPSSTGSGEQRSRASSISQSGSPRMNVAQAFDNMTFRSPNWGHRPRSPRDRPPSPHPKSPPRLMTAPIINAPEGDGLGPRLHIVPATPVSGGGAASAAVPFQTSLETLREPPQEQPLHFPRPRSSSDHDPPQWDNTNFIGQMGNIGSALDDEAPRPASVVQLLPLRRPQRLPLPRPPPLALRLRAHPPRAHQADPLRGHAVPPPVDFSGPQFLSPVDPPPSIRARGHYRSHSSGSWSNASSTRPSPYPSPHPSPVPLPDSLPSNSNLNSSNNTVSKQNVTTIRTQKASHNRRKQEATFVCPVPGCGSTFTRSFNLKGHIRSHNEERPFLCKWPGCGKGFALAA
ncbi:hypothetical protein R3P38DRAFT_3601674 [Favolaschia claudopus]|uniref:C2H2-type domain-containing protein n=1 Tax=Favolaschia claudopus TaxID=2862362 RepID=A0AAW0ABR1_9AGAR